MIYLNWLLAHAPQIYELGKSLVVLGAGIIVIIIAIGLAKSTWDLLF